MTTTRLSDRDHAGRPVSGFNPLLGQPLDGLLIRLPLRSHAQAVSSPLCGHFWSCGRMRMLLAELKKQATAACACAASCAPV